MLNNVKTQGTIDQQGTADMQGTVDQPVSGSRRTRLRTRLVAAALSIAAGLVHLWVAPAHLREWTGYGVFFMASAAVQVALAAALLAWPRRTAVVAGIGANAALIVVYTLSRTTGIGVGPHGGPESVDGLAFATVTVELLTVALLLSLLDGGRRRWVGNAVFALGIALVMWRAGTVP